MGWIRNLACGSALAIVWVAAALAQPAAPSDVAKQIAADPVLAAMKAEIERAQGLRLVSLADDVYFIQYAVDDTENFSVQASLGAIVRRGRNRMRVPRIDVRVGGYEFDNTNYVYSDFFGRRGFIGQPPIDDDLYALRVYFWLATDRVFKGAMASIARKRAALKNVTQREDLPDFSRAEPVVYLRPRRRDRVDEDAWTDRVRRLSAVFARYPAVARSLVRFESIQATVYLMNSEGAVARYPEILHFVEFRGEGQAPDGMFVRDAGVIEALEIGRLPPPDELERAVDEVARRISRLVEAPVGEPYVGPVLFEGEAAAQLFAQLLGDNLGLTRRPVPEPGRRPDFRESELAGRLGARVLPDWMDVVDDPTRKQWEGEPLLGHYALDLEGVRPEPLQVVEKGILKAFLLTRQPVREFRKSNGRARLPGRYGANTPKFSNLIVEARETVGLDELRRRLLEFCRQRGKPYGIVVRKLDFPSSASSDEIHRSSQRRREHGGARLFSAPIAVYRLYPDGREELVRGLEFRDVSARLLRDILAASAERYAFHFLGSNAPMSLMGAGGYIVPMSVVAPSVLVEDMELAPVERDWPTLPVVPPPPREAVN